jgi:hypothetical protein
MEVGFPDDFIPCEALITDAVRRVPIGRKLDIKR